MSRTKTKVDEKKKLVIVENSNLFEDERRQYKPLLDISVYSVYVEIPYEVVVAKTSKLESAAESAVKKFEAELKDQLRVLAEQIAKLQASEKSGNSKASGEASKLVKTAEKRLKDSPADYNIVIRKAIQQVIAAETKSKVQLRSVGRSYFRGMKLNKDAFQEAEEDELDMEELGDDLEKAGKKFFTRVEDEAKARKSVAVAVQKVGSAIEEAKKKTPSKLDYGKFTSDNKQLLADAEKSIASYMQLLTECNKEATKTEKSVSQIAKDKALKDNRDAAKAVKEFGDHFKTVTKILNDELRELGRSKQLLGSLRDDSSAKQLAAGGNQLAKSLGLEKPLKEMDKVFDQLQKLAKKR